MPLKESKKKKKVSVKIIKNNKTINLIDYLTYI